MAIYSGFTHWKWWFSIAMLVYQRVNGLDKKQPFWSNLSSFPLWKKRSFWSSLFISFHRKIAVYWWAIQHFYTNPSGSDWLDTSGRVNFHRDGLQCVNVSTWKLMRNTVKPENYEWPSIYTFPVGHIDILEHQISGGHIQKIKKLGARKYPPSPRLVNCQSRHHPRLRVFKSWTYRTGEVVSWSKNNPPVYKPWNAPKMRVSSPPKHGFWVVSCHGKDWSWVDSAKSPVCDFPHPATMIGKAISRFLGCPVLS